MRCQRAGFSVFSTSYAARTWTLSQMWRPERITPAVWRVKGAGLSGKWLPGRTCKPFHRAVPQASAAFYTVSTEHQLSATGTAEASVFVCGIGTEHRLVMMWRTSREVTSTRSTEVRHNHDDEKGAHANSPQRKFPITLIMTWNPASNRLMRAFSAPPDTRCCGLPRRNGRGNLPNRTDR